MKEKGSHRVLVIDDEPEMGDLVELILRNDHVLSATSGLEGLTMAKQDPPDLIILDLSLPDTVSFPNFDEYEMCRRFKTTPALQDIPVLLMEGFSPKLVYPKARQVGAEGYLTKPFGPLELISARDALLGGETYYPADSS